MPDSQPRLTGFDRREFLAEYWQKKPLLIRNAWDHWHNPLDPDELAGLACESMVEARLVTHSGDGWHAENGSFTPSRFGHLDRRQWTLLVQAVDHYVPEVAALLDHFRFIPNWRIDDVMVSLAADAGGVGPHFDQYDVFLIQGLGQRCWQIGDICSEATELLPHDDLKLLAQFAPSEEWVLEPGDMLYVPPGWSHNGVAVGDNCMTYSIGFRAPSRSELIGNWVDDLLADLPDDDRYADPDLPLQDNPGEISQAAIARLHAMITEKMADQAAFARWFGQYNSAPKYPEMEWTPEDLPDAAQVAQFLQDGAVITRNPASRCIFVENGGDNLQLFVDGEMYDCAGDSARFARQLCGQDTFATTPAWADSETVIDLVMALLDQGSLIFDTGD